MFEKVEAETNLQFQTSVASCSYFLSRQGEARFLISLLFQSLTSKRRTETTRPIFWSNRQRSYVTRTADWDEFPNGRWFVCSRRSRAIRPLTRTTPLVCRGDQSSPAFGDLNSLSLALPHSPTDASRLWGNPASLSDITALFARFCRGDLATLPWSDQPRAKETTVISEPLAQLNEAGFLTINSQPRVDGVPSSDPAYGWGPRNGYVYQKVSVAPCFSCPKDQSDAVDPPRRTSSSSHLPHSRPSSWT